MLKRSMFLLLLVSIALIGCKKDNTNNPNNPSPDGPTGGGNPILMSAEFNEVDVDNTYRTFKGESGFPYLGDYETIGTRDFKTATGEATYFSINSRQKGDDSNIVLTVYLGDGKELSEREYDLYDPEFNIMFMFKEGQEETIYAMDSNIIGGSNLEYNGEQIIPTGKINITKYSDNLIEGTFEFEAYYIPPQSLNSDKKVIVKNGTFHGKWVTVNT